MNSLASSITLTIKLAIIRGIIIIIHKWENVIATILPSGVSGEISPYPIVKAVTQLHHNPSVILIFSVMDIRTALIVIDERYKAAISLVELASVINNLLKKPFLLFTVIPLVFFE